MDCAACGRPLQPDARYCRSCGAGVDDAYTLAGFDSGAVLPDEPAAPPPSRTRKKWPVAAAVLVAAALVGGGLALLRDDPPAGPAAAPPTTTAAPVTTSARPTTPAPTPTGLVAVAPALRNLPSADPVAALFTRYFSAINARDYGRFTSTMATGHVPQTAEEFAQGYASTVDDAIQVVGITEREDGGLLVAVTFRSRQDPARAPPDAPYGCLVWQVGYRLVPEDGQLRIAQVGAQDNSKSPCSPG